MRHLLIVTFYFLSASLFAQWQNIPLPSDNFRINLYSGGTKHHCVVFDKIYESVDGIHWNFAPNKNRFRPAHYMYYGTQLICKGDTIGVVYQNYTTPGPDYKIAWSFDDGETWPLHVDLPTDAYSRIQLNYGRLIVPGAYSNNLGIDFVYTINNNWYEIIPFQGKLWYTQLSKLYMSSDTARTWKQVSLPEPQVALGGYYLNALNDKLVCQSYNYSTQTSNVYELFTDTTWIKNNNYPDGKYQSIFQQGNHHFVSTSQSTFRTSNNGQSWEVIGKPCIKYSENLLVANNYFLSFDSGITWKPGFYGLESKHELLFTSDHQLYFKGDQEHYLGIETSSGLELTPNSETLFNAFSPKKDGNVFATVRNDTLFYSLNGGLSVFSQKIGFNASVNLVAGNYIFLTSSPDNKIFYTTDFGITIVPVPLPVPDANIIKLCKTSKNIFWFDQMNGFIYASTLGNPVNLQLLEDLPLYMGDIETIGEYLFLYTYNVFGGPPETIYRINGSNDFEEVHNMVWGVESKASSGDELYFSPYPNTFVMKSIDGGKNWEQEPFPFPNGWDTRLEETQDYIYAYSSENLLFSRPKTAQNFHIARGQVFFDENRNGIKDNTENGFSHAILKSSISNRYASVQANGNFQLPILKNTRDTILTFPTRPHFYVTTPQLLVDSTSLTNKSIGMAIPSGISDLGVAITHVQPYRPGFESKILATVENLGSEQSNGQVTVKVPNGVLVNYTVPFSASQMGNEYVFSIPTLQPFEKFVITIDLKTEVSTPILTSMVATAQLSNIANEVDTLNNFAVNEAVTMGSYDPNDKQVSDEILSPSDVQLKKPVTYKVRFQNTGNYLASHVRIVDTLSSSINLSSLRVIDASHPYFISVRGSNILEIFFNNINLPDSTTNEKASHGFVRFQVTLDSTLSLGQQVENKADIYFDFNLPILTNTTTTEIKIVKTTEPIVPAIDFELSPNPTNGNFSISIHPPSLSPTKLIICDLSGRIFLTKDIPTASYQYYINEQPFSTGIYFVQLISSIGVVTKKLVID